MNSTSLNSEIYIGLGSNLESPLQQVTQAIEELDTHPEIFNLQASSLYQSKPIGPSHQGDYINAAVRIATPLTPQQLLTTLHNIENNHHRKRLVRWGPRTLDLDILVWHLKQINTDTLTIPHPEIGNRDFVLIPLYELNPNLHIPNYGSIAQLIEKTDSTTLNKITL